MFRHVSRAPWLVLSVGLLLGLAISSKHDRSPVQLPAAFLNATATDGGNTMALATGPIDKGVEGLFILDFITGELTCRVVNPRSGKMAGAYIANVAADLGVEQGKQPKYLMVTGAANFRSQGATIAPAQSIVYVADANTGRYVAYWLPWNRQAQLYDFTQAFEMRVLGQGKVRNVDIE